MKSRLLITFIGVSISYGSQATQLSYQPINPSFGGNPLNGSFLLSKAQSQNDHTVDRPETSFVERFQESLERNLLYSLTREITNGDFTAGTYNTGDYIVEVLDTDPVNIIVRITDIATGEVTEIVMPRVEY
ncbi:curli assembly protein CsgF [Ferrimonas aestuarii]|uniref:Curli production assembly/transport component CsgF n=1 Tax=Ferrimonas aestuarii TaxID=2569539 RepID=A0A4V5NWE2_9GAMM|nr:curli assembly protein CsgF [Ferrimonas aestuarii]TKB56824.1 curli production assembly protein CsgF [Ferrimonas aestuarii]